MTTWFLIALVAFALVIPFSIAGFYFIIGFKLVRIGTKENNFHKVKAGRQTMVTAFLGLLLTIVVALLAFKFL